MSEHPLPTCTPVYGAGGARFELLTVEGRLSLRDPQRPGYGAICADWGTADVRRRIAGGRRQLLAKAVGLHKQPDIRILDGTAGFGRDGFTLAALGAQVTLVERTPALVQLLHDARSRALQDPLLSAAATRVEIIEADTASLLSRLPGFDAIYLDPMYPEDGKKALPSKEMQILRSLTGGDPDADAMLQAALHSGVARIAVKRPAKAPWLARQRPTLSLEGTQARFDLYLGNAPPSALAAGG